MALRILSAESIVTKRVALAELIFVSAHRWPDESYLKEFLYSYLRRESSDEALQEDGEPCFAFTSSLLKGLRRFGSGGSDSLSEPVALRVREQPSWFGTHPESNPPKLSQSLFNKRCYLTARLLSDPWSNAFGKMAGEWVRWTALVRGERLESFWLQVCQRPFYVKGSGINCERGGIRRTCAGSLVRTCYRSSTGNYGRNCSYSRPGTRNTDPSSDRQDRFKLATHGLSYTIQSDMS
jgi:hypothetical protein